MTDFPNTDSLKKLQAYVWQMNVERGFVGEDAHKKLTMLVEEVGELAKAIRKLSGMKFTDTTVTKNLEEELADVQIVLLGLASILEVDLFEAVAAKEAKNRTRSWHDIA